MAISYVGSTGMPYNGTTSTFAIPPQCVTGDVCLGFLDVAGSNPTIAAPTGWTLVESQVFGSSTARVYKHTVAANEAGTSVAFGTSGSAGQNIKHVVQVVAYRGVDPSALDAAAAEWLAESTSTATHAAPTIAVSAAGTLLVQHYTDRLSTSVTKPGSATQRVFLSQGTSSGDTTAGTYDLGPYSSGTQGAGNYTGTNATAQAGIWTVRLIAATITPPVVDPWTLVAVYSRS